MPSDSLAALAHARQGRFRVNWPARRGEERHMPEITLEPSPAARPNCAATSPNRPARGRGPAWSRPRGVRAGRRDAPAVRPPGGRRLSDSRARTCSATAGRGAASSARSAPCSPATARPSPTSRRPGTGCFSAPASRLHRQGRHDRVLHGRRLRAGHGHARVRRRRGQLRPGPPSTPSEALAGACPIVGSYGGRDPMMRGQADKLDKALDGSRRRARRQHLPGRRPLVPQRRAQRPGGAAPAAARRQRRAGSAAAAPTRGRGSRTFFGAHLR